MTPRKGSHKKKNSSTRKYSRKASAGVRKEMQHMHSGSHPIKGRKQAIAIGLSKARKKGAEAPPQESSSVRKAA